MPGNKQKYYLTQQQCNLEHCPGFIWGRVDFLPSNCHSAVVWIQMRMMSITQECFNCCYTKSRKAFSASHTTLPASTLESTRGWEKIQLHKVTLTGKGDILHHTVSCSVYKLGGKVARGCYSGTGWPSVSVQREIALCNLCFAYSIFFSFFSVL